MMQLNYVLRGSLIFQGFIRLNNLHNVLSVYCRLVFLSKLLRQSNYFQGIYCTRHNHTSSELVKVDKVMFKIWI